MRLSTSIPTYLAASSATVAPFQLAAAIDRTGELIAGSLGSMGDRQRCGHDSQSGNQTVEKAIFKSDAQQTCICFSFKGSYMYCI